MSFFQELDYSADIQKVTGVQFSILSPAEIKRRSVAEIYTNETYDGDTPKVGGLFDPRMGVLDHGKKCPTDQLDNRYCPGYFGHIELAKKVFHIHYLKYTIKCLQSVCWKCLKLRVSPDSEEISKILANKRGLNRFQSISTICAKANVCYDCGASQPHIIKKEPTLIGRLVAEWKPNKDDEGSEQITIMWDADEVERILRRISDTDVNALGFNCNYCRPEWLICSVLGVPPPSVRPSVRSDNNTRMEDDLTHKLCDIIKTNKTLKNKIATNATKKVIDEWYQLLQYHVATLINNNLPGIPPAQQRSGRSLKAIQDRLKSKEGRVRGNLMGKRVDYSARTVITPDPRLKLNQLGVPIEICMNLTFPEKVNKYNKERLTQYVRNGYYKYPGAKSIRRKASGNSMSKVISLSVQGLADIIQLEEGDIVNRHLIKGDYVLFNRQPSLHRMSMMQHDVVPLPYKTFRLNVSVTRPYNADFDGDEMNMHVPQSETSRIELKELASVPSQIISPAQHKPIISIVQDTLVGAYLFTRYDNYLTKSECLDILVDLATFDGKLPEPEIKAGTPEDKLPKSFPKYKYDTSQDLWTGRQIFSMIIPPINLKKNNMSYSFYESPENIVEIIGGHVKSGVFDKNILGQSEQSLIHIIFNQLGVEKTQLFLDDIQNLITNWIMKSGFSVGLSDMVADAASTKKMREIIDSNKNKVVQIIEHTHQGILENKSGKTIQEEFEIQVLKTLNNSSVDAGKVAVKQLSSTNRLLSMFLAGSKGSEINIGQIIACVGQQAVDGKRIPYGFTDRTLPHFHKYDDGALARGFVESSFMKGLTPTEFFFHAMGGREGLIDTAVKSVTGDTPIIIMEDDEAKYTTIGEWIDTKLSLYPENIKHFTERQMELLYLNNNVYIPTTDEDGKVTWGEVTAVTRHDPGTELYEIKTLGGRSVIVTESKSLLIWNKDKHKLIEMNTPDIKIGDCVPVTLNLPEPPKITEYIDLTKYFPKHKYVYGSDFNKAKLLVNVAMNNRSKIENGWWNNNNNNEFTLPYCRKSLFTRTLNRSNISNIKNNCVYPFHATRECGHIPDKLELNEYNGTFIGLFIAEGNAHIKSGTVSITNNNNNIRQFVKSWFDNHSIKYKELSYINKIGGQTTTITGYSTILAKLLTDLVGHGAKNKYIPTQSFTASTTFIKGLLNGYFSGDGHINSNGVEVGSASYRLIEGVSMLCNRIGIFAKIFKTQLKNNNLGTTNIQPTYRISIRAQWAHIFAEQIELIDNIKNDKLKNLHTSNKHRNFEDYNDVVLDKIVEINIIGVDKYPKVYDLTIPSTLNFGLANGLQCRDTSETGYIQRRLVKAMEDIRIGTDYTVRNANGSIVQFLYGEDGFDGAKIEKQSLFTLRMSDKEIFDTFSLNIDDELSFVYNPNVVDELIRNRIEIDDMMNRHIRKLIDDRNHYFNNVFKGDSNKSDIYCPVNIKRLVEYANHAFSYTGLSDLNPKYVLEQIEYMSKSLIITEDHKGNEQLITLAHIHLAPKLLATKYRINRMAFDYIIATITQQFYSALAAPGELVGTISAQSIGEPCTQMSAVKDTKVLINGSENYKGPIGDFIDRLLEKHKEKVITIGDDSVVLDLDDDYNIIGVSNDEKTSWKRISQVSRHPANGGIVKVHTRSGKTTSATLSHSFLKRVENGIEPILGSQLKIGDRIPVSYYIPTIDNPLMSIKIGDVDYTLDKSFGWFIGAYLADGSINGTSINISKIVPVFEDKVREFTNNINTPFKI